MTLYGILGEGGNGTGRGWEAMANVGVVCINYLEGPHTLGHPVT